MTREIQGNFGHRPHHMMTTVGSMRLGVLDIGSNTVHLLIVDAHHGAAPVPAVSHKLELRLAERLTARGEIATSAEKQLIEFVREGLEVAEDAGATEIVAFATSAFREAPNGTKVLDKVKKQTGVDVDLLSGDEEARLTFLAVRRWFGWSSGRLLLADIGGGSLEMAIGADEEPDLAMSVALGAGRLTRDWFTSDPPKPAEVKALRKHVRAEVAKIVGRIKRVGPWELAVATSKTFKQMARLTGAPSSDEGQYVRRTLARGDLRIWIPKLAEMSADARTDLPGVSVGRARQLVAGALVSEAVMDLFEVDEFAICPWALREGVILERLDAIRV